MFFGNAVTNHETVIYFRFLRYRATGNIRENRTRNCTLKNSKELKEQERRTFDYQHCRNGEIVFVWLNDNKVVSIDTNFDTINLLAAFIGWNRFMKQKVGVPQPLVLKSYNSHTGMSVTTTY